MKSGFKDPTAIKNQKPVSTPIDGKGSYWDFRCPDYDQRTSCFINAGTHYGSGHKQPVGHDTAPKSAESVISYGRVSTMKTDEKG